MEELARQLETMLEASLQMKHDRLLSSQEEGQQEVAAKIERLVRLVVQGDKEFGMPALLEVVHEHDSRVSLVEERLERLSKLEEIVATNAQTLDEFKLLRIQIKWTFIGIAINTAGVGGILLKLLGV